MTVIASFRRQGGISLIEVVASLGIMGLVIAGLTQLANQYSTEMRNSIAAQHMSSVGTAAQAYITNNYASLRSEITAAVPKVITVPALIAGGFLPAGFSRVNNYGQTVCVVVIGAVTSNLNALVFSEGDPVINDVDLGDIAGTIGASGGGVYAADPKSMRGAMGGWNIAAGSFSRNCANEQVVQSATVGHPVLALWFSNGISGAAYLNRSAVPGRPEYNTMDTPLIMGALSNQLPGEKCDSVAAIARDAAGSLLNCSKDKVWEYLSFWRAPVANWAALSELATTPKANQNGDVRVTLDTNRAFQWSDATKTWKALAIDQKGDFNVPGLFSVGDRGADKGAALRVDAKGNVILDQSEEIDAKTGLNVASGRINVGFANVGGSCIRGQIAKAVPNLSIPASLLFCEDTTFKIVNTTETLKPVLESMQFSMTRVTGVKSDIYHYENGLQECQTHQNSNGVDTREGWVVSSFSFCPSGTWYCNDGYLWCNAIRVKP